MDALPSMRQLRYFVALAEENHFGHAAERCFVTQSTLSAGIRELEAVLRKPLFERTKRHVAILPLGREMMVHAKKILRTAEDMTALAEVGSAPLSGLLRLGAIPTIGPFYLPSVLPAVRASYPSLTLYVCEEQTSNLLEQLRAGELDCALIALPWETDGLETLEIMRDPLWLAVPTNHPLAKRSHVQAEETVGTELLFLEGGNCLRDHAIALCARGKPGQYQAASIFTLAELVANGLGVSIFPELATRSGIMPLNDIVLIPFHDRQAYRRIALVWREDAVRRNECRLLGHFIKNTSQQSDVVN
jgi:LysR family transcriptional regulator, hydrogen peroxide-inducible genes activator